MRNISMFFIIVFVITMISCDKKNPPYIPPHDPEDKPNDSLPEGKLIFSSGFEGEVYLGPFPKIGGDFQPILGKDTVTGFSWPIDILGASESALHPILDRGVNDKEPGALVNEIQTVIGHNGDSTKALYNYEAYYDDLDVTQCPYEILNITEGRKDLYVRYWMKMDRESLFQSDMWRAIFEWKTKDYAKGTGFRLIAYIYKDKGEDGDPFWYFQGDADPSSPIWGIENKHIPIPMNEWFLTEFYWHWSEGADGRVLWKVNGQVIGEHYGPTTLNSKPIDFIMLTQIYGDANPKYQWIDDIEIWDGFPAKYK